MDITYRTAASNREELSDDGDYTRDIPPVQGGAAPGALFGDHVAASSDQKAGFDDRKAPGAFRTIGEVAKALGIRQHVLRYWEEQFPMLSPVKRSGNRRYYRPEDVVLIERIDRLVHHEGYTLRGARLALEPAQKKGKRGSADAVVENTLAMTSAAPDLSSASKPWLDELLAIRATLIAALAD